MFRDCHSSAPRPWLDLSLRRGPSANSRGISPGVCALAVVGPNGKRLCLTLWPEDGLNAADAYGQAPKVPRPERMSFFSARAIELLCDAVEDHSD